MQAAYRTIKISVFVLSMSLTAFAQNRLDKPLATPALIINPALNLQSKKEPRPDRLGLPQTEKILKIETANRKINKSMLTQGTGSSGGGDATERMASSFKNTQLLKTAVQMAINTMNESDAQSELKEKFVKEINSLADQGLILEIPAILLSEDYTHTMPQTIGYKMPKGDGQFLDLACATKLYEGAKIICSTIRIAAYNEDQLAETLLHEVLHHVLPRVLSMDEDFVEDLSGAIIENNFSKAVQFALKHNIYIRKGNIIDRQFLDGLLPLLIEKFGADDQKNWQFNNVTAKRWKYQQLVESVRMKLKSNIAGQDINWLPYLIFDFFYDQQSRGEANSGYSQLKSYQLATDIAKAKLIALGIDITTQPALMNSDPFLWGCLQIQKGNILKKDKCVDKKFLTFEDVLLPLVK